MLNYRKTLFALLAPLLPALTFAADPIGPGKQESETGITHSFLAFGDTYIISDDGKIIRTYAGNTRDGWLMPNGNLLLATNNKGVEVTPEGKVIWEFKGTQKEVNTIQDVGN